jgi:hypothetical protein
MQLQKPCKACKYYLIHYVLIGSVYVETDCAHCAKGKVCKGVAVGCFFFREKELLGQNKN